MHTTGSRTRIGKRPLALLVGIVAAIAFGLFAMHVNSARAGVAVTFTVNNSTDAGDGNPGDGVCDTVSGPPVICTLRAAIEESNALNGPNVINFTATNTAPLSDLPTITERVTIDASANPDGFSIDASGAGADTGLTLGLGSSGSIIRGLNIFGDSSSGIAIEGGANQHIGGDPSLGAAPAGQGNILHGNGENGIVITDGSLGGHIIEGNRIGTTPLGISPDGNGEHGILIDGGLGALITIGGFPNLISASGTDGIHFIGGTAPLLVQDNWIGLDVHGNASDPFANNESGVYVNSINEDETSALAAVTIRNNHIAGGGVDPTNNQGDNGIDIHSPGNTVLGNCIGFNSTCTGSAGGFSENGIEFDVDFSGGNIVGDGTAAGRNVIGNTAGEGVVIGDSSDPAPNTDMVVNGNYIGFGADGEENATIFNDCVKVFSPTGSPGGMNKIINNLMGNCGYDSTGAFPAIEVIGDNNLIQNNDLGRGTTATSADPIDGHCILLNGSDNRVLTNVMANCGGGLLDPSVSSTDSSVEISGVNCPCNSNVIQGNDITSPPSEDAIGIVSPICRDGGSPQRGPGLCPAGGIANLVAGGIIRMVDPGTGDLPFDLDHNGVTVNDPSDLDPGVPTVTCLVTGTNFCHNYPVFAPTSLTAGCARGSAGPYDHVRIYSKSTAGGVTTYEQVGEGDANIAGDFQVCINNLAQMAVVGTSTTTVGSTTDVGCFLTNCTSEFSVTEQVVPAGATATATATNTPTITLTPTITNTPPPTATPTNTPVPPTNTPVPPTNTPVVQPTATPHKFCGDVNDNGSVDSVDALLILQLSAGMISTVPNAPSADVNHSGTINPIDASLILQEAAGLIQISDLHCS
jgi:hypothetical protein